jgi:YD repeat-containing protein
VLTTISSGSGSAENVTLTNEYTNKGTWLWRKSLEVIGGSSSGTVRVVSYTYDINGNLLTKTYFNLSGAWPVETYTYDSYGNIATYEDPKGNITTYNYDTTETYVTSINYPSTGGISHSVSMTYNDFGKIHSETDENNNPTYYNYDAFGRLHLVEYPGGGETEYTYVDPTLTAPAYIKTSVLEDTETVDTYQYVDGFGRALMNVSKGVGNNKIITITNYDNMGRVYLSKGPYLTGNFSDSNPFSHTPASLYPTAEKTFDYMGRVVIVKTPKYQGSQSQFDTTNISYNGFATTVTDPKSNTRTEITDYLGRIIEVQEDSDGGTTFYDYNAAGDLVAVEDDEGNMTSISYNTLGQKLSMNDPDMGIWSYTYDL